MHHAHLAKQAPHRVQHLISALALCGAAPGCLAFGSVGALPECATFTTCSAAVGSSVAWQVRQDLTHISVGFSVPNDLVPGTTVHSGLASNATNAALAEGFGGPIPGANTEFSRNAAAKAQSDIAVNRIETSMSRGVAGALARGNGTADLKLSTFAQASSAWRDVWSFNGSGNFSAVVTVDGRSTLGPVGPFDASFSFTPNGGHADWFYELRVWDVDNFSISDEFELGGPTPVTRARLTGFDETRPSLDGSVALNFDFVAGVSYVVTAQLQATSYDGREIDLYHTARLQDVVLSGGVQMTSLSGHDYLAPVPEPGAAALLAGGLAGLLWLARRRRPQAAFRTLDRC